MGVYTDGDIRRTLMQGSWDINTTPVKEVMTTTSLTIKPGILAAEALAIMQQHKITSLVIVKRIIALLRYCIYMIYYEKVFFNCSGYTE